MDVPFISSGAQSRAHYALVRKVETATSTPQADQYLMAEVKSIRIRLRQPGLSLKSVKECLVVILYCSMTITSGLLAHGELDFALPQAVNLAEAGATASDKRLGYLFCAEIMPRNHELQLMLVNTLRKDLENPSIPRICLALDNLIHSTSEDVIPAVQSRLHDLLSHNSPHVRRRAILAFRALSIYDPELLKRVASKVQKRLRDPEPSVIGAALVVSSEVARLLTSHAIVNSVNECLRRAWETHPERSKRWSLLKVTRALLATKPTEENLQLILEIIRYASNPLAPALLYGSFRLLSLFSSDAITEHQTASGLGPLHGIRRLLISADPNEQYVFLSSLQCLEPDLWSGTHPSRPAVLDGWEVERVMKFLDSSDNLLRKKTLQILHKVDPGIVSSYYAKALQGAPSAFSAKEKNQYALRLLEVVEIQCGADGEFYGRQLKELFAAIDHEAAPERRPVLENAIEKVLLFVKEAGKEFESGCATTLIVPLVGANSSFSSTLMVIISALASECTGKLAVAPVEILRGLASRLASYTAPIQDACLLSMLRVAADCDEVPPEVLILVQELAQQAGKHIRNRCNQFVTLSGQRNLLEEVVSRARSPSLPDFLDSLVTQTSPQPNRTSLPSSSPPQSPGQSNSRASLSASKLRYTAYEAPQAIPRLRRPTSSQHSYSNSSRSGTYSDHGGGAHRRSSMASEGRPSLDELSRTVTAGDLALASGDIELERMSKRQHVRPPLLSPKSPVEDLASRVDLIAFDSPFILDPHDTSALDEEPDFESIWNAQAGANSRGWCEVSNDIIVRRLQCLPHRLNVMAEELPPFEGDLKIIVSTGSKAAALRLRESDDESCLWRLRCTDSDLRASIRGVLNEA